MRFKAQKKWVNDISAQCSRRLNRDEAGERNIRRPSTTREMRIQMALNHIREHGFLRFSDYIQFSGLSRTTASRELACDKSIPITSQGRLCHKVYVKDKNCL